jgi:hypothetical protein
MADTKKSVKLKIPELKKLLRYNIKNNQKLQKEGKGPIAIEVQGDSGIGKTSVASQIAKELGIAFVKLNLAQIEELGDLIGFPHKEFEIIKEKEGKKIVKWVPEITIPTYIQNSYKPSGRMRMTHAAPEWIEGKEEGGIFLLDDWTRADIRFVQGTMELVDRQQYHSWSLPKNWHIILTSNPDDGEYMVNSIDVAQRTRFISVDLIFDLKTWVLWAEQESIDSRCINFMIHHGDEIMKANNKAVNPRSITTFFNAVSSIENFDEDLPTIQIIGEGSVGTDFATMFTSFIDARMDKLISPHDILHSADEKKVMESISESVGKGKEYRSDIASILVTRIVNFTLIYAEKNDIEERHINRLINLITHDLFNHDLKYHMAKKLTTGNRDKFREITAHPEAAKLLMK